MEKNRNEPTKLGIQLLLKNLGFHPIASEKEFERLKKIFHVLHLQDDSLQESEKKLLIVLLKKLNFHFILDGDQEREKIKILLQQIYFNIDTLKNLEQEIQKLKKCIKENHFDIDVLLLTDLESNLLKEWELKIWNIEFKHIESSTYRKLLKNNRTLI